MLRRHLSTRHGLTGEQYLKRWNLPSDHPLTAPTYSEQRSSLAKELGLGRGGRQAAAAERADRAAAPAARAAARRGPEPRARAHRRGRRLASAHARLGDDQVHRHVERLRVDRLELLDREADADRHRAAATGRQRAVEIAAAIAEPIAGRGRSRPAAPARAPASRPRAFPAPGCSTPRRPAPRRAARRGIRAGPFLSTTTGSATVRPCADRPVDQRPRIELGAERPVDAERARPLAITAQLGSILRQAAPLLGAPLPQRDQPLALGPPPELYLLWTSASALGIMSSRLAGIRRVREENQCRL